MADRFAPIPADGRFEVIRAMSHDDKMALLAGLVAMSGYLAESDDLPAVIAAARAQPVLIVHGTEDDVLGITLARRARQTLAANGLSPDYQEFAMAHEVSEASLAVVGAFLKRHLPAE